jgi:hypothetical protein
MSDMVITVCELPGVGWNKPQLSFQPVELFQKNVLWESNQNHHSSLQLAYTRSEEAVLSARLWYMMLNIVLICNMPLHYAMDLLIALLYLLICSSMYCYFAGDERS